MDGKNIGKNRFFKVSDRLAEQEKDINKRIEATNHWRAPTEHKRCYEKKDYIRRKVFQYLTLGVGPAVAEKREECLNELRNVNLQQQVDASFAYVMSIPLNLKDDKQKRSYDKKLGTVLEWAICCSYTPVIQKLLSMGVKVVRYHMFCAMINNSKELIDLLIQHGGDPNSADNNLYTLLHYTAIRDEQKARNALEELLEAGGNVNTKDAQGRTVLHIAIYHYPPDVIRQILGKGADVHAEDKDDITPLHCAMLVEEKNYENIELLLKNKANPNAVDKDGRTPISCLVYWNSSYHKERNYDFVKTVVKLLLKNKANINHQDACGETLLHYLCRHKGESKEKRDLITFLIDNGADPNMQNNDGKTPLHRSAFAQNHKTVKLLLDNGADQTIRDEKGRTPLNHAQIWDEYLFEKDTDRTVEVLVKSLTAAPRKL